MKKVPGSVTMNSLTFFVRKRKKSAFTSEEGTGGFQKYKGD